MRAAGLSRVRAVGLTAICALGLCCITACSDGSDGGSRQGQNTALVFERAIHWLNDGARNVGYGIDAIPFTVLSKSVVHVDVLSVGAFSPALDAQVYLAHDDGSVVATDFIDTNDDGEAGADGSSQDLDSYLSVELEPGDYLVYVSGCCFSAREAMAGYRLVIGDAPVDALVPDTVNGMYQLSLTGHIAARP